MVFFKQISYLTLLLSNNYFKLSLINMSKYRTFSCTFLLNAIPHVHRHYKIKHAVDTAIVLFAECQFHQYFSLFFFVTECCQLIVLHVILYSKGIHVLQYATNRPSSMVRNRTIRSNPHKNAQSKKIRTIPHNTVMFT